MKRIGKRCYTGIPFNPDNQHMFKSLGFRLDVDRDDWYSLDEHLSHFVIENGIKSAFNTKYPHYIESYATYGEDEYNSPEGLVYKPHQIPAISYLLNKGNVLLADDMGLGKTIEVIGYINNCESVNKVLIISPVTGGAILNWDEEIGKWLSRDLSYGIVNSSGRSLPNYDILIISYDKIESLYQAILSIKWDLLVVDEAHMVVNPDTIRALYIYGGKSITKDYEGNKNKGINASKIIALTGTPTTRRPDQIMVYRRWLIPGKDKKGRSQSEFQNEYFDKYGHVIPGKNSILQVELRDSFMLRRTKEDAIKNFPQITYYLSMIDSSNEVLSSLLREEISLIEKDINTGNKPSANLKFNTNVMKVRESIGLHKSPHVISMVKELLEKGEKVLVFVYFRKTLRELSKAFPFAIIVSGDTKSIDRHDYIKQFQSGGSNLFIATMSSMTVSATLTEADSVVIAEFDHSPSTVSQAISRAHRIGRKNDVKAHFICFKGSYDERIIRIMLEKNKMSCDFMNIENKQTMINNFKK